MTLGQRISDELLPRIRQPGQYIGGEWNQPVRPGDWDKAELRVALGFPDTYAIGMSHLGSRILYHLCNETPGVCAERVFAPWLDAEKVMRERKIPLFTWDTRQPVRDADIFGVTLQYELSCTNLLLMLDLAGIPLHNNEREENDPLVILGGPQADNPEPVADFVDLVVIGDGENAMAAILDKCKQLKRNAASRRQMILELAKAFEWIYAPALYTFDYHDSGTIRAIRPSEQCPTGFEPRLPIFSCQCADFENATTPEKPLVPHTETVHDRIGIEIMRGCPNRCRFCHAGYTKNPLRWRSVDRIVDIAEKTWQNTGYDEIGLLSLSSANYPHLHELTERLNERFHDRRVNLSIPSLRVDKMLSDIPQMVSSVRKSGLTIAVEAACDDMRDALRKKILDVDLLEGVRQAYTAGWNSVKLYFMAGFPGEQQSDLEGIFELSREVSLAKKGIRGGPASVTASVGWLVPKPHTPLQWAGQADLSYFLDARDLLKDLAQNRKSAVRISTHNPRRSLLEGVIARGDRRLGQTIEAAYQFGARMDSWNEVFDFQRWQKAFDTTGINPAFYAQRTRQLDEILPWDHIHGGPPRDQLEKEYCDFLAGIEPRTASSPSE